MLDRREFRRHPTRSGVSGVSPLMLVALGAILPLLIVSLAKVEAQDAWQSKVKEYRDRRNESLRTDPFSPLGLIHREYLDGRTHLSIGNDSHADLGLDGKNVAPVQAQVDVGLDKAMVHVEGGGRGIAIIGKLVRGDETINYRTFASAADLANNPGFAIAGYNLLYRADAPVRGAAIEVYDTALPSVREFRGLEFFPIDARYRVQAEITPRADPPLVQLVDSAGQPRPYFVYGDLRFTLDGQAVTMEVYTPTLDPAAIERSGFMLIFADATSGKESYYAARYLDIEGKLSGLVTLDFNLARNPPCAFSPVFTCPFPRPQNKLAVVIRAGEKAYRGKTATPLQK